MISNPLLLGDSYKYTHWKMYPPKTETVYSYFESRGGLFKETVFFGLQYLLQEYLCGTIVTPRRIAEAETFVAAHLGDKTLFNRVGWEHIVEVHGGRLPVEIRAVPEGTSVPVLTPLMTIENTDPSCWWLTNFLETLLSQIWYSCTVSTVSREIKKVILAALERSGDPADIRFKLHDFGFRGVSSVESAAIGGAAHLVNFMGTDNVMGARLAMEYYAASMPGFSIPAAEHSTITSWGSEHEVDAFRNMLTQFPKGLVSVVSDSYDIYCACRQYWGKDLKDLVMAREGCLVVRPDSGVPEEVVVKVLDTLGQAFGTTVNAKGYRVLDPHVRVIQGDGIDYDSIRAILGNMEVHGWSADNLAFGMGGALLQKLNRDTQMFAFKCSSATVDGQQRDVFKKPVTQEWKKSKPGRFEVGPVVFRNGEILVKTTFDEVRTRAALPGGAQ